MYYYALLDSQRNQNFGESDFDQNNFVTPLFHRGHEPKPEKKDGEIDEKFWEILMSADKKDYESICAQFGVTDFRWMLKKLNEKKKEREEEQAKVCCHL